MKRSPLRANPEKTRAWQDRSRKPLKRTAVRRARPGSRAYGDFSSKVRSAVSRRSQGRCEAGIAGVCTGRASQHHHRKLRRFGDHSAANDLHSCLDCHDYIHGHPAWSRRHGLLLREYDDPEKVPVSYGAAP